jgi:hypothetical protein
LVWGFDPFVPYRSCDGAEDCVVPGCVDGFVAHRPNGWYASADFVPLTPDSSRDIELVRNGAAGPTVLSTSDLDFEFDAGGKFTLGKVIGDCYRVEGTFLGNYAWDDRVEIRDFPPNPPSAFSTLFNGFPPGTFDFASVYQHTAMNSAEVNVRYWLNMPPGPFDVSVLVGARYLNLDEQFAFRAESPAFFDDIRVNTDNDLYGVQLGIEGAWLVTTHAWFDFDLKGALCQNFAAQATTFTSDRTGAIVAVDTGRDQQRTSFIGDLSLTFNVQCTPTTVFHVGYTALFINGVALAAENVNPNTAILTAGPAQLDDRGEIAIHGPMIGFTWAR